MEQRQVFTTPVLYHGPSQLIGCDLPTNERHLLEEIKTDIRKLLDKNENAHEAIFQAIRKFNRTDALGMDESMGVLHCVMKYMRHLLADVKDPVVFLHLVEFVDALIRKAGIRAHVLIGRKKFLQTLSIRARQFKKQRGEPNQDAADFTFDCIQAWHEAFYELRSLFPHFEQVYKKLLYKYHVEFLRSENDPSRLPIVLEQCDDSAFEGVDAETFLYSENIDADGGESGVDYDLYENEDSFKGESGANHDQLKALEHRLQEEDDRPDSPNDDIAEHASFSPPEKRASERRIPLQQVVSQRSFQVRRSNNAAGNNEGLKVMTPVEEEEGHHEEAKGTTPNSDGATPMSKTTAAETTNGEESVTIENRAVIVDGRIGIDTRATLSPSKHGQHKQASIRLSGKVSGVHDQEDNHQHALVDADGKVRYDNYKSDKKLKTVGSHLYNQKSVRVFSNIDNRVERYSSRDSQDSEKLHKSLSKSRSGGSEEMEPKVEIRFFGNQRVVVAKGDKQ